MRASAEPLARHASVEMRLSARVCGEDFLSASEANHFCASGLMVEGMGTTRMTWAVPSESKVAESGCGTEPDCADARKQIASPTIAT